MRLMTPADSERIPEIGVSVDSEVQSAADMPVPVAQPSRPFTMKNGVELKMCMYDNEKERWISGSQGDPTPIHPPSGYQVSL